MKVTAVVTSVSGLSPLDELIPGIFLSGAVEIMQVTILSTLLKFRQLAICIIILFLWQLTLDLGPT